MPGTLSWECFRVTRVLGTLLTIQAGRLLLTLPEPSWDYSSHSSHKEATLMSLDHVEREAGGGHVSVASEQSGLTQTLLGI